MRDVSVAKFTAQFNRVAYFIRDEPVLVRRGRQPIGVFMSCDEYIFLQSIEDAYWSARAQRAVEGAEFLSPEETMRWIIDKLKGTG